MELFFFLVSAGAVCRLWKPDGHCGFPAAILDRDDVEIN